MKILLDECVPKRLGGHLLPHDVGTVPQAGWSGIKNGRLLSLAQTQFDVFLTVDKSLHYQQEIANYNIAVVVLRAPSNAIEALLPLVDAALVSITEIQPGEYVTITADD